jgi:hypothetical protein
VNRFEKLGFAIWLMSMFVLAEGNGDAWLPLLLYAGMLLWFFGGDTVGREPRGK